MTIKQRLKDGGTVVGGWCLSGSPVIAECLAISGFDFVVLDMEHGAISISDLENCIARIQKHGKEAFVRCQVTRKASLYLDMGATGIIGAHIDTPEDAAALRNACQYQEGRSYSLARCTGYGSGFAAYIGSADKRTTIVGMIESEQAVDCLPAITEEGLDAVMIGPYDLSASMGIPGQFLDMTYIETVATFVHTLDHSGVAYGYHDPHACTPTGGGTARMKGARFICLGMDTTMVLHLGSGLAGDLQ